eukprot:gene21891-28930_t
MKAMHVGVMSLNSLPKGHKVSNESHPIQFHGFLPSGNGEATLGTVSESIDKENYYYPGMVITSCCDPLPPKKNWDSKPTDDITLGPGKEDVANVLFWQGELLEAANSYRVQSKGSAAVVQTAALHQKKAAKASKAARATPAAVPPLHMWEIALADDSPNEDARDEASEEWTRDAYKTMRIAFKALVIRVSDLEKKERLRANRENGASSEDHTHTESL